MTAYYVDGAVGNDSNAGTSAGAGNAWATVSHGVSTMSGGDTLNVKDTATYSISAALAPPAGSATNTPTIVRGYSSTPGDGGLATIQLTAGSVNMFDLSTHNYVRLRNFILDCNSQTSSRAVNHTSGTGCVLSWLTAKNFTDFGFAVAQSASLKMFACLATGGTSAANAAFYGNADGTEYELCGAIANACHGFRNAGSRMDYVRCIAANLTGTHYGFVTFNNFVGAMLGCVAYANGGDGLRFNDANCGIAGIVRNCIFYGNGGYGWNSPSTNWADYDGDYNAFGSNTSGSRNQIPAGANDVSLSGDPFASGGSSVSTIADLLANFAPNSTSGAGAALRGAGWPAYLDIGAIQHQDSGGGGGSPGFIIGGF